MTVKNGKIYFYHAVPKEFMGETLLPLSKLYAIRPDLYAQYAEKYRDRPDIMLRKVPLLDCLWNEVVQLLPLHPRKVFGLQVQLGLLPSIPDYSFFQIDPSQLDPKLTVVFSKIATGEENSSVSWLRDVDLAGIQNIPEATIRYFESLKGTGELPFNYQFIPHILYKGVIDISNCRVVSTLDNIDKA